VANRSGKVIDDGGFVLAEDLAGTRKIFEKTKIFRFLKK
jgi:hypothetical protein